VGDAVRDDGTLKDASEMEWQNSPTDENFKPQWGNWGGELSELEFSDSPSMTITNSAGKLNDGDTSKVSESIAIY